MALIERGQQPIWRPRPSAPRPPLAAPAPKMGPYPIGAALRVASDHTAAHPMQHYYQVIARVAGLRVSIQSDTFTADFWAEYGHQHERATDYQTLVRWLVARDTAMVANGVIDHAISDSEVWWVVPYPRLPDMATRMEG